MDIKELRNLEVGKTFAFENKTLKVIENTEIGCWGCFFHENEDYCCYAVILPYCGGFGRNGSNIIFKELEEKIDR